MENENQWEESLKPPSEENPFAEKKHHNAEPFHSGHLISWLLFSFFLFLILIAFLVQSPKISEMDPQQFAEYFPKESTAQAVVFGSPT